MGPIPSYCPECIRQRKRKRTDDWHKDNPEKVRVHKGRTPEIVVHRMCVDCNIPFDRTGTRGPLPDWCDDCTTKRRREKGKANQRATALRRYGISETDFDEMLARQNGVCVICGTDQWGKKGPMIDHCHESGRVRGILCLCCNMALGGFRDDLDTMRSAIKYLEGFQ